MTEFPRREHLLGDLELLHFDPLETYKSDDWDFRDRRGRALALSEDLDPELIIVGYRALCHLGSGKIPAAKVWKAHLKKMGKELRRSAARFDMGKSVQQADHSLPPVYSEQYQRGPVQIMLLHYLAVSDARPSDAALWATLALLWVDHVVYFLLSGDAPAAVSCALRAERSLSMVEPALTRAQARSELARAAAEVKLASDPKQLAKNQVKALWLQLRTDPKYRGKKAPLARDIMDIVRVFENEKVLTDWFRTWEERLATGAPL